VLPTKRKLKIKSGRFHKKVSTCAVCFPPDESKIIHSKKAPVLLCVLTLFYCYLQILHLLLSITQDWCNYFHNRVFDEQTLHVIASLIGDELCSDYSLHYKGVFDRLSNLIAVLALGRALYTYLI
jgi:hypothetical protein